MTPATDERLTIEPPPVSFIARTASRQPRNVPSTLTALTLRQSASVAVSMLPRTPMPALLTRMSRPPKFGENRIHHLAPVRFVGCPAPA